MKRDLLTVQEAANVVGVSTSTLKRLCESSSIDVIRTPGGHRRIDKLDLDRVVGLFRRSRLGGRANEDSLSIEQVMQGLLSGKPMQVAKLFSQMAHSGTSLLHALENYLVAAMWRVGQLWRDGKLDVYQEHICTNTALTAVDILRQQLPEIPMHASIAVGGSFAPSYETIPSKLIALGFELIGIRAFDLGGAVPIQSMALAAKDLQASIVWVTHTHVCDAESLLACHQALHGQLQDTCRIVVGGGGLSPAVRRSIPWCVFYETISEMVNAESALLSMRPSA
jgi:excisionase family DNA binding protein